MCRSFGRNKCTVRHDEFIANYGSSKTLMVIFNENKSAALLEGSYQQSSFCVTELNPFFWGSQSKFLITSRIYNTMRIH